MKLLAVSCSPRKNGNTVLLLETALDAARKEGAETELFTVAGKTIQPCDGCWACVKTGKCHIKDDMTALYDKLVEADGIIFGTPIYFWGMTAQAKAVIDRSIALNHAEKNLANRVCGAVVVAGSLGLVDALKDYAYFIIQKRMLPANMVAAYTGDPADTKKMEGLLKDAGDLGRQMVELVKLGFRYPPEFIKGPGAFGVQGRK